MNTSFDLLDGIMIDLDLDREISFGELILDESIDPITSSCERGIKRERSQTEVVQSVTDSEDGITEDERDELKEFLQGIGFLRDRVSSRRLLACIVQVIHLLGDGRRITPLRHPKREGA
ncbi:hypothetical protein ACHAXN_005062 [Cyclotella atomus]|jgi:hypothetical protein